MNTLLQNVRFAVRTLFKERVFTAVTIATLALGIGVNTPIRPHIEIRTAFGEAILLERQSDVAREEARWVA